MVITGVSVGEFSNSRVNQSVNWAKLRQVMAMLGFMPQCETCQASRVAGSSS